MAIEIITEVEDRAGKRATSSVFILDTFLRAQVELFALQWSQIIDDIILGVIRSVTAILHVDISALTNNTPTASSDVEEVGAFEFVTTDGNRVKCNVPGINELLVNNDTGQIDTGQTAISNLISMFEDGISVTGGILIHPTDIGSDDIVGTLLAEERFRNSGRRR